jgi:LacI family transcriptional regulator
VTAFDDIAMVRHVRPAITTVPRPMRELGEQSVRTLLARIADPAAPRQSIELPDPHRDPQRLRMSQKRRTT